MGQHHYGYFETDLIKRVNITIDIVRHTPAKVGQHHLLNIHNLLYTKLPASHGLFALLLLESVFKQGPSRLAEKYTIQYGYMKCETRAQVFSPTLAHENRKNEGRTDAEEEAAQIRVSTERNTVSTKIM